MYVTYLSFTFWKTLLAFVMYIAFTQFATQALLQYA